MPLCPPAVEDASCASVSVAAVRDPGYANVSSSRIRSSSCASEAASRCRRPEVWICVYRLLSETPAVQMCPSAAVGDPSHASESVAAVGDPSCASVSFSC